MIMRNDHRRCVGCDGAFEDLARMDIDAGERTFM